MSPIYLRVGLIFAIAILAVGCSKGPKVVPVTGTVKLDGKPLTDATVVFNFTDYPRPAAGRTDAAGHFILAYNNRAGAPIGSCKVVVRKTGKVEDATVELIPSRYNNNTQLQYEITKAGPNEFNLELDSTPDEADLNKNRPPGDSEEPSDDESDDEGDGVRKAPPSQAQPQQNPEPSDDDDDG